MRRFFLGVGIFLLGACSSDGSSSATGGAAGTGGSNTGGGGGTSGGGGSAGSQSATGGSAGTTGAGCGTSSCSASEVCVAYRTLGGAAVLPDDAGACPTGTHVENGQYCFADFAYQCVTLAGCSSGNVTCACAQSGGASTCPDGYTQCTDPGNRPDVDAAAVLICEQLAP